jgi:hypothetical protein
MASVTSPDTASVSETLISLETAALQRWGQGDPSGFLEISAPGVSYFDPFLASRIDGLPALSVYYDSIRGKVHIDRFELLNPVVVAVAELAVLTFNFVSCSGADLQRWNCTEVYRLSSVGWRIVQTHWSLVQPLNASSGSPTAA